MNTLLVAARGHDGLAGGELTLGKSTIARVETAASYFEQNREQFEEARHVGVGGFMVMSGGYATLATGRRIVAPPYEKREGHLMKELAIDAYGVPEEFVRESVSATTTLEVVLRPYEEGHFTHVGPENPLTIVAQKSQLPRLRYFAGKLGIIGISLEELLAPGEESDAIYADEKRLMLVTRLLFSASQKPSALRRSEAAMDTVSRILLATRLIKPPAQKYLSV